MQVVLLVHVGEALEGLEHDVANHLLREELSSLLHELVDVEVQVFKDEVKVAFLQNDLIQLNNIWMRQSQK